MKYDIMPNGFKRYGFIREDGAIDLSELDLVESTDIGPSKLVVSIEDEFHAQASLRVEQVKELIGFLENFVEDAESSENWRNHPDYVKYAKERDCSPSEKLRSQMRDAKGVK